MTRRPPSRVRFTRSAVADETSNGSGYTACSSTLSVSISRLLTPEWRRTDVNRTPAASSAARILGVIGRRGGHLRTPRNPGEQTLVRVQGPDLLDVTVVDRRSRALQDRLERPGRGDEPEPPDSPIRRDVPDRRVAHAGLAARLDPPGGGVGRSPP